MTSILFLLAFLVTSASAMTEREIEFARSQRIKVCQVKNPGIFKTLARWSCNAKVNEAAREELAKTILEEEMPTSEARVARPTPAPTPDPEPASVQRSYDYVGGVAHETVRATDLVSVYKGLIQDNRLWYKNLPNATNRWAPSSAQVRLVIMKDGRPCSPSPDSWCSIAVRHGTDPTGFEVIYADLNKDGETDSMPVYAVDAKLHHSLYLTWRTDEELEFYWLKRSGNYERVQIDDTHYEDVPVWKPASGFQKGKSCIGTSPGGMRTNIAAGGRACS